MRRSQKTKRVSWATDVNLCQVRLFSSEESPSQVVLGTQNHLQEKAMWSLQSGCNVSDDNLPPGFERMGPANLWGPKLSQMPLIKWRRPRRIEVNTEWQVVAGEESKELETQNQREMRVFEAIYPRPSSIPPNPYSSVAIENSGNEHNIPLIPINPIEDDDAFSLDASFGAVTANSNQTIAQHQIPSHMTNSRANGISSNVVEPNMLASARAALTSILSNSNQKNLVDQDLLIKILSDPKMVEQLVTKIGSSSSEQNVPPASTGIHKGTSFSTQNKQSSNIHNILNLRPPTNIAITRPEICTPSIAKANGPIYPDQTTTAHVPNLRPPFGAPMVKDMNYYKSLIQQHGEETRDGVSQSGHQNNSQFGYQTNLPMRTGQERLSFVKPRESKPKIMKACIYFKSSKGCRNGANCAFQHETSVQKRVNGAVADVQNAKRVKLDREIAGV